MRNRCSVLALLCVLVSVLLPSTASAHAPSGTENRVWDFSIQEQASAGGASALTLELRPGSELSYDDWTSGSPLAARRGVRTAPRNLGEKLALDEAKGGAGKRIMQGKINDPEYPEDVWAKMQHVHEHPGGSQSVIHYWENLETGAREGFKFK